MTCIVGIKTDDNVLIAGDLQGSSYYVKQDRSDTKVFRVGDFIFGMSGSYRDINLLKYRLKIPRAFDGHTDEFIHIDFLDAVRQVLRDQGAEIVKDSVSRTHSNILFAYIDANKKPRLMCIQGDYQIAETAFDYAAIGSGMEVALGALYGADQRGAMAEDHATIALNAAARFNPYVGKEHTSMWLIDEKPKVKRKMRKRD